jgi:hypothetical protein
LDGVGDEVGAYSQAIWRRRRQHGDFQRAKRTSGVAVGDLSQEFERVVVNRCFVLTESAATIRQRAVNDGLDFIDREWLKLKDAAATDQRVVHGKKWIGCRDADQDYDTLFDVGQQCVLLRAIEAMNFIDHKERGPAARSHLVSGLLKDLANVLHAARHGTELAEAAVRFVGQQPRERCLSNAGRTVKNDRSKPPGAKQSPQQLSFAEKVLLADKLAERRWPHPRGKWLHFLQVVGFALCEKVGHKEIRSRIREHPGGR